MSPLDDHLRRAMHARADVLAPSPDPLAGIESRARGMKRRRVTATMAGAALAVAAIAVVVPSLAGPGTKTSQLATQGPTASPTPAVLATPPNLLSSWPQRGVLADGPSQHDLLVRFAQARSQSVDTAHYRALYTGRTTRGVHYTYGQAWFTGDPAAYDVGYATGGTNGPDFFLGPTTPHRPQVLAYLVTGQPGATTDLLVVIPDPRTTQVLYDGGPGTFRPVSGTPATDGVVLVDRAFSAAGGGTDRLQLLTGNGDPATDTTFQGSVSSLLCGVSGCG